ncbi:MAG: hypothetical protein IT406_03270 [Candidatus Yanofskybacteria bacterium]|nr:hypothetical protein [Candidatus Yanofskybacteria bacterium]
MNYQTHLAAADPVMRVLVQRYTLRRISVAKDPLEELVASIVSQQLSVKAALELFSFLKSVVGWGV